jgi:hypothetical protein
LIKLKALISLWSTDRQEIGKQAEPRRGRCDIGRRVVP